MIIDEYQETQVLTASPQQLHLMVVDGALLYARRAAEALDSGNREEAFLALNRSREFVAELLGGLRVDQNPETCVNLKQLFAFVFHRLAMADIEQNPQLVGEAIRILEKHRETWLELMSTLQQSASTSDDTPAIDENPLQGRSWSA